MVGKSVPQPPTGKTWPDWCKDCFCMSDHAIVFTRGKSLDGSVRAVGLPMIICMVCRRTESAFASDKFE